MTDLPNRATFLRLLTRAIESARRRNRKAAVLFIDLDRFKIVDDCHGHAAMGRTLGVCVVAEGVETGEQEAFLRSLACDEMQGFYFSKPAHPDVLAELLRQPTETLRKFGS